MNTTNNTGAAPEATNNASNSQPVSGSEKNTLMGILSYIGPLAIVAFLVAKDDPFVKYHVKQGFVLLTIEIALWALGMVLWIIWPLINLAQIAVVILSIIGIVNVVGGKEKELPVVGKYASHFKI